MDDDLEVKLNKNHKKVSLKKESFKKKNKSIKTKLSNLINKTFLDKKNKNEIAIKTINKNEKPLIKKQRNPGIDLVRLIAMYGTIINHLLYINGGDRKYSRYSKY